MQNKKIKLVETTQRTPEKISHRERHENVSRNHAKNIMRHHQKPKKSSTTTYEVVLKAEVT